MKEQFEITCPCCQSILTVDPVSAKVVKHATAPSRAATFDLAEEVAKLRPLPVPQLIHLAYNPITSISDFRSIS